MDKAISMEAVRLFVQLGNLAEVSRQLGIPAQDLYRASKKDWWMDEEALIRKTHQAVLDAQLTRLHDMTVLQLLDRVENGERFVSKVGVEYTVPMKSADLARVAHVVFTERQLLRDLPTAIAGETTKVQVLAEKLERLGLALNAPKIAEVVDIEVTYAEETSK